MSNGVTRARIYSCSGSIACKKSKKAISEQTVSGKILGICEQESNIIQKKLVNPSGTIAGGGGHESLPIEG
jgi:hypothetical protein